MKPKFSILTLLICTTLVATALWVWRAQPSQIASGMSIMEAKEILAEAGLTQQVSWSIDWNDPDPVSYTHLTLPTTPYV